MHRDVYRGSFSLYTKMLRWLLTGNRCFLPRQELVQVFTVKKLPAEDYGPNLLCVSNIIGRICVKKNQIRNFPFCY